MRTASQNLFYFSGQTAESSPWLRARQNGGNGLDREVALYDHFRVRSTARSVTIGGSPAEVKSGSKAGPGGAKMDLNAEKPHIYA